MDPPVYGNGTDACPGIGLDRGGSSRLSARYDSGAADTNVALVLVHTDSLHAGARAQQLPDLPQPSAFHILGVLAGSFIVFLIGAVLFRQAKPSFPDVL